MAFRKPKIAHKQYLFAGLPGEFFLRSSDADPDDDALALYEGDEGNALLFRTLTDPNQDTAAFGLMSLDRSTPDGTRVPADVIVMVHPDDNGDSLFTPIAVMAHDSADAIALFTSVSDSVSARIDEWIRSVQ